MEGDGWMDRRMDRWAIVEVQVDLLFVVQHRKVQDMDIYITYIIHLYISYRILTYGGGL